MNKEGVITWNLETHVVIQASLQIYQIYLNCTASPVVCICMKILKPVAQNIILHHMN